MAHLGYETGEHAPGRKEPAAALAAAHHLLLAHGRAVPVIRSNVKDAHVGLVVNLVPGYAASDSAIDYEALRRFDGFFNRWYLDPIFFGRYPDDAIADRVQQGHLSSTTLPFVKDGDLQQIAAPIDWLGINYYSRAICRGAEDGNAPRAIAEPTAAQKTDMGWEVFPDGLAAILQRVHRDYAPRALYVTENGAAYSQEPDDQGRVDDAERVHYVRTHVDACARALQAGVPLRGYFLWSLLDNFEWQWGYLRRFGIVHVDYATQKRTLKDSALVYRDLIAAHTSDRSAR
jgi:beta-glucosidase